MATTVNRGKQQITVYPYEELTSVNANQILQGLIQPGVSNTKVELVDAGANFGIKIKAGATFVFKQSLVQSGVTRDFLIKAVFEDDAERDDFSKALYWGATNASTDKLYIYADLNYDLENYEARFVDFSLTSDFGSIATNQNLVVASLHNNLYFVGASTQGTGELTQNLGYYYISYSEQNNRNALNRLYDRNNSFQITFDGAMQQFTIAATNLICGNSLISMPSTTMTLPSKVTTYPAGKSTTDFYQVDVLRLKVTKSNPRVYGYAWESLLLDKPVADSTYTDWTWENSYSWDEDRIFYYLKNKDLLIQDSGHIVLIMIRPNWASVYADLSQLASYMAWAVGGFNKIHASICYAPNMFVPRIDEQDHHSRFKLPIYATSEVTT